MHGGKPNPKPILQRLQWNPRKLPSQVQRSQRCATVQTYCNATIKWHFPATWDLKLILCNQIRRKLLDWYDLNHRVLPWRRNPHSKLAVTDPNLKCPPANLPLNEFMYYVWVCEVSHPSLEHTFSGSLGKIVFSPCKLGHVLCLLTSHANQRIEKCGSRSCHSKRSCHE